MLSTLLKLHYTILKALLIESNIFENTISTFEHFQSLIYLEALVDRIQTYKEKTVVCKNEDDLDY